MSKRTAMAPTLRSWMVAGALGTSLALLFDGERGERRRKRLEQGAQTFYRRLNGRLNNQARLTTNAAYQNVQERLTIQRPDNPEPDDNTLRDRIESQVFSQSVAPQGEYNLNVERGIAVLRGQLTSQEDIQALIRLVAEVPDVRGVESFLHTPGTPAPNKESAIEASDAP